MRPMSHWHASKAISRNVVEVNTVIRLSCHLCYRLDNAPTVHLVGPYNRFLFPWFPLARATSSGVGTRLLMSLFCKELFIVYFTARLFQFHFVTKNGKDVPRWYLSAQAQSAGQGHRSPRSFRRYHVPALNAS
jgi:hypothetical protein